MITNYDGQHQLVHMVMVIKWDFSDLRKSTVV